MPQAAWSLSRSAGNYERAIEKQVVDWKLVSLMDVVRAARSTAPGCWSTLSLRCDKGRIKVGADADIIVFDPAKAKMTAAAESHASFSRGMNYVIVEGQLLIEEGRMNLTLLPGQPIRRAVKPRGTIARITGLVDQREQGA